MADRIRSPKDLGFPSDFLWGAATASYQIEGGASEDGRGVSIWDTFSHTQGKVKNGDNGDVACDHYHRWRDDIALMRELGLDAYRLSIAWPRIIPQGRGQINEAGLDFYEKLIDGLLEAGIKPFVTLYHWDLPQALQDEGGWANRNTAYAFAEFAEVVTKALGDRVPAWMTLNEPWVVAACGNLFGEHAPGYHDLGITVKVAHNLMLGHGLALPRMRKNCPNAQIGIALSVSPAQPLTDKPEDVLAAMLNDAFGNRLFLDPLQHGTYPAELVANFPEGVELPVQEGDMELISAPIDFLGINYYQRTLVSYSESNPLTKSERILPEGEYTNFHWEVYPEGLRQMLERLHRDYTFPAYYVTENGASFVDRLEEDGAVHDARRLAYLQGHFAAAAQAVQSGVPLKGYFVWSLLDNFEWGQGYSQRFGLVYVDYPTQRRFKKDSALWYQRFLAARSEQPVEDAAPVA